MHVGDCRAEWLGDAEPVAEPDRNPNAIRPWLHEQGNTVAEDWTFGPVDDDLRARCHADIDRYSQLAACIS